MKKIGLILLAFVLIVGSAGFLAYKSIEATLPQIFTLKDYKPHLVSQVYDRNKKKIGEFFRERRTLIPYKDIPKNLIYAFLAAEDDQFFEHRGINLAAIARASLKNMQAGRSVQGGSTITQQMVKTLLLTSEKTLLRKIKEAILAIKIEENLSKEDILYLYLNQIFLGPNIDGVVVAAETYFRKPVQKLRLSEMAILAGLPQAPSRYSPVKNPTAAKERQIYVLRRMVEVGFIKKEEADAAIQEPVKVYVKEKYEMMAPFYLETIRQLLVVHLGEDVVLNQGVKIYTGLDIDKQNAAQKAMEQNLRDLDKRQGYRGPLQHLASVKDQDEFLLQERKRLIAESTPERTILPTGEFAEIYLPNVSHKKKNALQKAAALVKSEVKSTIGIAPYVKVGDIFQGIVEQVDDKSGIITVRAPDMRGMIGFQSMKWARKVNPDRKAELDPIRKPSEALKSGDVVLLKLVGDKFILNGANNSVPGAKKEKPIEYNDFVSFELEQEPVVEGSLISFDQQTEDVLAMVGGYNFEKSKYNRTIQAARQTGSSFKSIVYAAALDKGYTPSTPIVDAPIIYEQHDIEEGQEEVKVWRPSNHGRDYNGDIIFRSALVKSLNIPTVKIIEDIGVPYSTDFARRLGIFSPLNPDFTMALGTSSVTLYEMTKAFSTFGRMGKRIRPVMVYKVVDPSGKVLMEKLSLDVKFSKELKPIEDQFAERRKKFFEDNPSLVDPSAAVTENKAKKDSMFFFPDEDQLIRPQTAYLITSLLKGVVEDPNGTGGKARALGREVAGKTGTSNGYYDAWFLGYTAQIATGVWVGFDHERTLGKGEVGGRAALPAWIEYMKKAHENLPVMNIPVPDNVVFVSIDSETGKLASSKSKNVIKQAFLDGTQPTNERNKEEETTDFLKQDLNE